MLLLELLRPALSRIIKELATNQKRLMQRKIGWGDVSVTNSGVMRKRKKN